MHAALGPLLLFLGMAALPSALALPKPSLLPISNTTISFPYTNGTSHQLYRNGTYGNSRLPNNSNNTTSYIICKNSNNTTSYNIRKNSNNSELTTTPSDLGPKEPDFLLCGGQPYHPAQYTCYASGNEILCPTGTAPCISEVMGTYACYSPRKYRCQNETLAQIPAGVFPPGQNGMGEDDALMPTWTAFSAVPTGSWYYAWDEALVQG